MNLGVTHGACLILGRLVMKRGDVDGLTGDVSSVTTQAEEVDIIHRQQPRVGRAVGRVAIHTTLPGFHWGVFEDVRSHLVGMALGADGKLTGGCPQLTACQSAVGIVTVAALDQSRIDTMTIGAGELRLFGLVTTEAEFGLAGLQQEIDVSGFVRVVATCAREAVGQVFRFGEVLGLGTGLVALGANGGALGRRQRFEANDFRDVSTTIDMRLARAMARLTPVLATFQQR